MLVTTNSNAHKKKKRYVGFPNTVLIPTRTFLFALYVLADSACINVEVFIYGVKINASLQSITSWEPVHWSPIDWGTSISLILLLFLFLLSSSQVQSIFLSL